MRTERGRGALLLIAVALLTPRAFGGDIAGADVTHFENHIRPLLASTCYACHGPEKQEGTLRLDRRPDEDRAATLLPQAQSRGTLLDVFRGQSPGHPPVDIPPSALETVLDWISRGAPWPPDADPALRPSMERLIATSRAEHWAFQPVVKPAPPALDDHGWGRSPIDAFVAKRLAEAGLAPSAEADRRTLIRRLYYDLTGLPPSYEAIERFVADESVDAYGRLVDDLLASPRYGERWARHWLDVARYSDTRASGFEEGRFFPFSYTYRDYVVRAYNQDLPYNDFIRHQIAADRLDLGRDKRPLAALGFLTLGRPGVIHDVIDDQIDVVSRGLMAMTVNCARCHDHKFDPIPTADYYALYGIFRSAQTPAELPIIGEPDSASPAYQEYAAKLAELEAARDQLLSDLHGELATHLSDNAAEYLQAAFDARALPDDAQRTALAEERTLRPQLLSRWLAYLDTHHPDTGPIQLAEAKDGGEAIVRQALEASDSPAVVLPSEVYGLSVRETRIRMNQRNTAIQRHKGSHPGRPDHAMALENTPEPFEPYVFVRGTAANKGDAVSRHFLTVLAENGPEPYAGHGRLQLAEAIASDQNPLTARVYVNRVWMHLFGQPLVDTPSDFGLQGSTPTHPELLDYLAASFVEDGWSTKRLIRRIVMSSTYQQQAISRTEALATDPGNTLLWRQNRRRLDFEAMRDSVLVASDNLDTTAGGEAVDITDSPSPTRRTLYGIVDREDLPAMYRIFDFAAPTTHSPGRFQTTVPQQGLFMMNSPFVAEQARRIAANTAAIADADSRIDAMYQAVLGRAPLARETELGHDFVANQETADQSIPYYEPSEWRYGYGRLDEARGRITEFTEFPYWTGDTYQGAKNLPAPETGPARLDRLGGHPGEDGIVVVRRWVSPAEATLACVGELHHGSAGGDGVKGYIVSSREGILWRGDVQDGMVTTVFDGATIQPGDTVDLVVAAGEDADDDQFRWHPRLYLTSPNAGTLPKQDWLSRFDYQPPPPAPPKPLTPWEQYAQVLLMSNEFIFVD